MGAKDCLICYAEDDVPSVLAARHALDRVATEALVRRLFPDHTVTPEDDGTLGENANPDDGWVFAAVWPGASLVCTSAVALDRPSLLDRRFLAAGEGRTIHVHAMHSVVDWTAFATWGPDGRLRRALSVSGADGDILEDLGERLSFEEPFWAGAFPASDDDDDDYPFPFHPLELGETALHHLFGFVFEGFSPMTAGASVDPFDVTLAGFRVTPGRRRGLFRRR